MIGKTVHERMQQNGGYLSGPRQGIMNNAAPQAPAEPQAAPAPNYREAEDMGRYCMECRNYAMEERRCNQFNFEAKPHFTCDAFAGEAEAAPVEGSEDVDKFPMPA